MATAHRLLITIDGPAGAGKTTVSQLLAQALGYRYLDTGALYRAVAFAVRRDGIASDDDGALKELCDRLRIALDNDRLILDGVDVSTLIRSPEITMMASAVSARPVVRQALLAIQREIGLAKGVVAEGRDMGTVVFPDADFKFFLDATIQQRALRRFAQYGKASGPPLEAIENDIRRRDANDRNRDIAPLKPAVDAITLDASKLTARQVVDLMLSHVRIEIVNV